MKEFRDFGIDLSRSHAPGPQIQTLCPQCSHTRKKSKYPCLSVNLETGLWCCHHCDWAGSLRYGEEQKASIARQRNYHKPVAPPPLDKPGLKEWFERRAIPWEIVQRHGITLTRVYFPQVEEEQEAIAFPYYRDGELVNVKYRSLAGKLFRMAPHAERILYGMDDIKGETLTWCEGEADALAIKAAGVQAVVSVPDGAPSPTTKHYESKFDYLAGAERALEWVRRHIIAVDADDPGETLARELVRRLGPEKCFRVRWASDCKDANDVLMSYGPEVLKECLDAAEPWPVAGIIQPASLREAYVQLYERGRAKGVSTGWPSLDTYYTIRPGECTLVTGIPAHGKSSVISALAVQVAELSGWRFAICPPEQQPLEQYCALFSQLRTGAPFYVGWQQRMSRDEALEALTWQEERISFLLTPDTAPSLTQILDLARIQVFRRGVQGLIIDPYNELDHSRPQGLTETEYISQFISQLRIFARRHQVHVWIVAHPTKLMKRDDGSYPVPTAYDVSGSSHWYNKLDNILTVYRDAKADDNHVQIHVQKVRFRQTGKPGMVDLFYHQATGRISE